MRPNTAGWRTCSAGTSRARSSSAKWSGSVDVRQQVGDRDELAVVQPGADEAGVVVAPLLAVGDDVHPGPLLGGDGQPDGVVGVLLELVLRRAGRTAARAAPARSHAGRGQLPTPMTANGGSRRGRSAGGPVGRGPTSASVRRAAAVGPPTAPRLADQVAPHVARPRPRDQLVAGQPAHAGRSSSTDGSVERTSSSCPGSSGSMCRRMSSSRPLPQSRSPPSKLASGGGRVGHRTGRGHDRASGRRVHHLAVGLPLRS